MLTNKCKYAIRAVLFLSVKGEGEQKLGIQQIAEELKTPAPFTAKILQELSKKDIISSVKGPRGGFFLKEENLKQPLMNIVEAIDGLGYFHNCGLGLVACSDDHPCPFHNEFKASREILQSYFEGKTIAELANDIDQMNLILVR